MRLGELDAQPFDVARPGLRQLPVHHPDTDALPAARNRGELAQRGGLLPVLVVVAGVGRVDLRDIGQVDPAGPTAECPVGELNAGVGPSRGDEQVCRPGDDDEEDDDEEGEEAELDDDEEE